jgi:hypothetical protein
VRRSIRSQRLASDHLDWQAMSLLPLARTELLIEGLNPAIELADRPAPRSASLS